MIRRSLSLTLLSLVFCVAQTPAQTYGGEWQTSWSQYSSSLDYWALFGRMLAGAGDVDGDGFDDVIIGAPGTANATAHFVEVWSPATGVRLHRWSISEEGCSVDGIGDVNGDGFDDLLVGTRLYGSQWIGAVTVYSGATGGMLWRRTGAAAFDQLGYSVTAIGDVDGDGVGDVLAGALMNGVFVSTGSGYAVVYSGATGGLIRTHMGVNNGDDYGLSVTAVGDINHDGVEDYAVSSRPAGGFGEVGIYSGANGAQLGQISGVGLGASGTIRLIKGIGDVDNDGRPDLGVAIVIGTYGGEVYVVSGVTGQTLHHWTGIGNDQFGNSIDGVGDLDGDGHADVLVGVPNNPGKALLYSGAGGAILAEFSGTAGNDFGEGVAHVGDVNADGYPDIAVGEPKAIPPYSGTTLHHGKVYVFSLRPALLLDSEELSITSGVSATVEIDFPLSEAGKNYAVVASLAGPGSTIAGGVTLPLANDRLLQHLLAGRPISVLTNGLGVLDGSGDATATIAASPALAPVLGSTIYFAAASFDSGPLAGRMTTFVRTLQILP